MKFAEYIWLDGSQPTQGLRSKTRIVHIDAAHPTARDFPEWSFDGSSTGQAEGRDSDRLLRPACIAKDPLRDGDHYLVLCEVLNADGSEHATNARAELRAVLEAGAAAHDAWAGFEQEYTLFQHGRPLGFPEHGMPAPQGPYYCSVGSDRAFGRDIAERHAVACQQAGLVYYGLNAEVMPGQWEFQVGYRGNKNDDPSMLNVADNLWLARYLLQRIAEQAGVLVSFDNKPMKGDWNGAGLHTNFSTKATRGEHGLRAIHQAVERLQLRHGDHVLVYGHGLEERLTGEHETCSIAEFKVGNADRGASIRIPPGVQDSGRGYFEDRRPGANADPYRVAARLAATVFGIDDEQMKVRRMPHSKLHAVA